MQPAEDFVKKDKDGDKDTFKYLMLNLNGACGFVNVNFLLGAIFIFNDTTATYIEYYCGLG